MTTTNDRPFIARAERWHENRGTAEGSVDT